MGEARFSDIGACVFDVYGTLLDFNAAVARRRDRIGERADTLSDLWRRKQLEYTWLRSLMGRHADFWQVTGDALDFSMAAVGLHDADLRTELMDLYRTLEPFPEVAGTLRDLKKAGMRTAVLSNGEPGMLRHGIEAAGIGPLIDAIYSVETVGIFKPHPSVYRIAADALELAPQRIAFQSANGWDIAGAASFGFATVWINRSAQQPERLPAGPAATLPSLEGLPRLVGVAP
jgi:2-haloacid dehalogenase